jgi:anti-sigma regulatory factor (Ser/Thr protein kinase)
MRAVPAAVPCARPDGRAGKGGGLVHGPEFKKSVTIAAVPEQVRAARAFVSGVLGSHPHACEAVLLTSETVANSVRHSGSAAPGGVVTVTVAAGPGGVRVEVTDSCGDGSPVLLPAGRADAEGGRGLRLVDALAARWGYERGGGLATTWFELVPG